MKVLYKNKVGKLVPLHTVHCVDCIYYPKSALISQCIEAGLMKLCVSASNFSEFILSSSDVLEL